MASSFDAKFESWLRHLGYEPNASGLGKLIRDKERLAAQNSALSADLNPLKFSLERAGVAPSEEGVGLLVSKLKTIENELRERNSTSQGELMELQDNLKLLEARLRELEGSVKSVDSRVISLEPRVERLESRLEFKLGEIDELRRESRSLSEKLDQELEAREEVEEDIQRIARLADKHIDSLDSNDRAIARSLMDVIKYIRDDDE